MSSSLWDNQLEMNLEKDKVDKLFDDQSYNTLQLPIKSQFEIIKRFDSMSTTQAAFRFLKLREEKTKSQLSSQPSSQFVLKLPPIKQLASGEKSSNIFRQKSEEIMKDLERQESKKLGADFGWMFKKQTTQKVQDYDSMLDNQSINNNSIMKS